MKFCDNPRAYHDHKNNKLFIPQTELPEKYDKRRRERVQQIGQIVYLQDKCEKLYDKMNRTPELTFEDYV
jgi:hypothetical protein